MGSTFQSIVGFLTATIFFAITDDLYEINIKLRNKEILVYSENLKPVIFSISSKVTFFVTIPVCFSVTLLNM